MAGKEAVDPILFLKIITMVLAMQIFQRRDGADIVFHPQQENHVKQVGFTSMHILYFQRDYKDLR